MPKTYTPKELEKLHDSIVDHIFNGKSLRRTIDLINKNKKLPNVSRETVYQWLNPESPYYQPQFSDQYARAREDQADHNADMVEDIAADVMDKRKKLDPQAARVAIDAHKWAAGNKRPRKYGNRQFVEQKSKVEVTRKYYDLSCLSDEELDQYEALMRKIMLANGEDPDEITQ